MSDFIQLRTLFPDEQVKKLLLLMVKLNDGKLPPQSDNLSIGQNYAIQRLMDALQADPQTKEDIEFLNDLEQQAKELIKPDGAS
jgi:hypothetical protein